MAKKLVSFLPVRTTETLYVGEGLVLYESEEPTNIRVTVVQQTPAGENWVWVRIGPALAGNQAKYYLEGDLCFVDRGNLGRIED